MRGLSRTALLLAVLLLAALLFSSLLPALHSHEDCGEHCPVCGLILRAERLLNGLALGPALCLGALLAACAAGALRQSALRRATPVLLRVKLTN